MNPDAEAEILVLGIGNLLRGDDGFGVRAVEALEARYRLPAHVRLVDGGTLGPYLLPLFQAARRALIFDAVDFGLETGTLKLVRDAEVPRCLGYKQLSVHEAGLPDLLASAELLGQAPEHVVLIGVQPAVLDVGTPLSPAVAAQLPQAVAAAVQVLQDWGAAVECRAEP